MPEPHMRATESASFKILISLRKYNNPSQYMWPHLLLFCSFVLLFISVIPSDTSLRSGREGGVVWSSLLRDLVLGRYDYLGHRYHLLLGFPIKVEPETRIRVQVVYLGRTPGHTSRGGGEGDGRRREADTAAAGWAERQCGDTPQDRQEAGVFIHQSPSLTDGGSLRDVTAPCHTQASRAHVVSS